MVIIAPANEKAEPPPYTPIDPGVRNQLPSPSTPDAGETLSAGGSTSKAKSSLRVVRITGDILGHWEVNPKLPSPPEDGKGAYPEAPPPPPISEGPNVFFETHEGLIDVSVAWILRDKTVNPPRAKLEAISHRGSVSIINTIRPDDLPLHIKVASRDTGDVKIIAPHEFHGVLALRIPAPCPDWRSRIHLAEKMAEQVSCTRETTSRVKGKSRQNLVGSPHPPEEQMLVELLVGSELDVADFATVHTPGSNALDFIEVESNGGRIMILSSEDAALGNDQFPEPPTQPQQTEKTFRLRGLPHGALGVTVKQGGEEADANGGTSITLMLNEPKWARHVMKKLNRWGTDGRGSNARNWQESPSSFSTWRRPLAAEVRVQAPTPSRTPEPPSSPPVSTHPWFRRRLSDIVYSDLRDDSLQPPGSMRRSCRSASASSLGTFNPAETTGTAVPPSEEYDTRSSEADPERRSGESLRDEYFQPRHAYSDDGIDAQTYQSSRSTPEPEGSLSEDGSTFPIVPPLPHSRTFPGPNQARLRNPNLPANCQQTRLPQTQQPQNPPQLPTQPQFYPRSPPPNSSQPMSLYPASVAASMTNDAPSSTTPLQQSQNQRILRPVDMSKVRPYLPNLDVPGLRKSRSHHTFGRDTNVS